MTAPATIVAIGEPMIEFNQARSEDASTYLQGFGGDTSNMAIAAARLGARVGYVTRLGNDAFGQLFLDLWARGSGPSSFWRGDRGWPSLVDKLSVPTHVTAGVPGKGNGKTH